MLLIIFFFLSFDKFCLIMSRTDRMAADLSRTGGSVERDIEQVLFNRVLIN